jgi:hypothetical protein
MNNENKNTIEIILILKPKNAPDGKTNAIKKNIYNAIFKNLK